MSRFAVLADLLDGYGGVEYGRGGGGGGVARGRYGDDVLFYLSILFADLVSPTGGDDEQGGGGDGRQVGEGHGGDGVEVEGGGGDGVAKKRTRKTYVPRVYDDHSVKVLVVAPFYLNEEVVPFPPFLIRNRRDAKKAAADARTGSYGKASISHGSYGEGGNLQFY